LNQQKKVQMKKNITLSVFEIVGSPLCVASDDGQGVYDRIASAFKEERNVTVSFRNVSSLTSAFLNAAIGQLYGTFKEDQIRSKLKVKDMQPDDLALLKRVVDTAKEYFKDPKRFNKAVEEAIGDGGNREKR
jgi:STAS-like domain of unknown function (DUF4325)